MGVNVAVFTYEPPEVTIEFSEQWAISYPILYDEQAHHVKAFDVINPQYNPGDSAFGIPLPGVFYISPEGIVRDKFYRKPFQKRPPWQEILERVEKSQQI